MGCCSDKVGFGCLALGVKTALQPLLMYVGKAEVHQMASSQTLQLLVDKAGLHLHSPNVFFRDLTRHPQWELRPCFRQPNQPDKFCNDKRQERSEACMQTLRTLSLPPFMRSFHRPSQQGVFATFQQLSGVSFQVML